MSKIMIIFSVAIFTTTFVRSSPTKHPESLDKTVLSLTKAEKTSSRPFLISSLHKDNQLTDANTQLVETQQVQQMEDITPTDNVVHRPLFVHRKRSVRSRGIDERHIYSDNYRNYPYPHYPEYRNRRIYSSWNYPSYYRAPVQVKRRLRRPSITEDEFPVLI